MTNKTINTLPFKVKCVYIDPVDYLTVGKEYDVVEVDEGLYKVKNDNGEFGWYYNNQFETLDRESNPKDRQEFYVGDKVKVVNIDDYVSLKDKNVKEGDIATVIKVSGDDVELSNTNWKTNWWFSQDDVSFVDSRLDYHLLSPREVVQAVIDGKELEMQYKTGKWANVIPMKTTLHQLANLNFRLKPSLEDKRKAVIKKLLTTKVAVLCKCWDGDVVIREVIVAITEIGDGGTYNYMNNCLAYEYAYAIDDNGNEITNLE